MNRSKIWHILKFAACSYYGANVATNLLQTGFAPFTFPPNIFLSRTSGPKKGVRIFLCVLLNITQENLLRQSQPKSTRQIICLLSKL